MARNLVAASTQYLANTSGSPVSGYPFSVSARYKPSGSGTNRAIVSISKTGATERHLIYAGTADGLLAGSGSGGTFGQSTSASSMTSGTWYQVGGAYGSATSRKAVLNGTVATADTTSVNISGMDRVYVGAYYNNGLVAGFYGAGDVCDVGVWDVELSADEWAALGGGLSPLMVRPQNLVAYWPLLARATDEEDWTNAARTLTNTNSATAADHPRVIMPRGSARQISASAATSHATSGDLASDAAAIAGTATHLTLHTTSGALASDAAAIAGTATHLTLHATEGALASDAATIAGTADHAAGGEHPTDGALSSDVAAIAGTAAHYTLHAASGALAADGATIAGTAVHLTLHTTSGAMAADAASMAGEAVHSGAGAVVDTAPTGGGWAWAAPRKKRHDYLSPPTREQMAERVRQQRIALGILPKPAQKRIEAAAKKEARRREPDIAELAPLAAEVAQDSGASLQDVIDAIAATFATQRGLVAARLEADAAQRREAEALAAERARADAEAREQAWQARLPALRQADEELLAQEEQARQQAIQTIRQVQKQLLALIGR